MSNIINADQYIKVGDKLYKANGGGGANILTYDSLDAVPDDLAEGSFVAVPSTESGGGGLPVVVIDTALPFDGASVYLTEDESNALDAAAATGLPAAMNVNIEGTRLGVVALLQSTDEGPMYAMVAATIAIYYHYESTGVWSGNIIISEE